MKKPLLNGIAVSCLWVSFFTCADAQTAAPEKPNTAVAADSTKHVRVQVEFINVSHEQFTELMFGPKPPANDGELRQQVAQLIKDGKATIMETLLCTGRSGQKASSESIEEFIYPTEYEPAALPSGNQVKNEGSLNQVESKFRDLATGPTPTAFDTRNVGSTLEIAPTLSSEGKIIDLRFTPEIVYHVGNEVWSEWKGEHGNSPIQMPTFYTLRMTTAVTIGDGEYMLAAALSPKDEKGVPNFSRKLMVFVRADAVSSGR